MLRLGQGRQSTFVWLIHDTTTVFSYHLRTHVWQGPKFAHRPLTAMLPTTAHPWLPNTHHKHESSYWPLRSLSPSGLTRKWSPVVSLVQLWSKVPAEGSGVRERRSAISSFLPWRTQEREFLRGAGLLPFDSWRPA